MPCVCGKDITCLDEFSQESQWVKSKVRRIDRNIYGKGFINVNYHTTKMVEDSEGEMDRHYRCRECGTYYTTESVIAHFGGDV